MSGVKKTSPEKCQFCNHFELHNVEGLDSVIEVNCLKHPKLKPSPNHYCGDFEPGPDKLTTIPIKTVKKDSRAIKEVTPVTETDLPKPTFWYDAFKLKENPFRYFEGRIEEYADLPFVETPMLKKLEALVKAKTSCILEGERGCGKTCLINFYDGDVIKVITPRNVRDIYTQIFPQLDQKYKLWVAKKIQPKIADPKKDIFDFQNEVCRGCFAECEIKSMGKSIERIADTLDTAKVPCPVLEREVPKVIEYAWDVRTYLIDCPDNLSRKELKNFTVLCDLLTRTDSTLIVCATKKQTHMLKETDTFSRFPVIPFDKPGREFFRELYERRLVGYGDKALNPSPFSQQAVDRLIDLSDYNVRAFIELCNLTLVEMWAKGLKQPCDLAFLESLKIKPKVSERDAIFRIIEQHRGEWVNVQQLAAEVSSILKSKVTARKMGAFLSQHGFTMRKRDDKGRTQVLITELSELSED